MPVRNVNIKKLDQESELQGYKQLLCSRLGHGWAEPDSLQTFPYFLVKSRDASKKRENKNKGKRGDFSDPVEGKGDKGERELLSAAKRLKQFYKCPSGYFISDTELEGYEDNSLQIDAIFISPDGIVVFEAKQYNNAVEAVRKAERQLDKRVEAIKHILNEQISVHGATVLPFTDKGTEQNIKSKYHVLFKQDLHHNNFSDYLNDCKRSSVISREDKENALAKILTLTFLREDYPSSEEQAIHLEAQRIFFKKDRKYNGVFKTPSFNSITLTNEQEQNAKSMRNRNTVINGPYGCGKTITIIKAIQNQVRNLKKGEKLRILFLSGQLAFSANKKVHYSPFLNIAKVLIKEALAESDKDFVVKGYEENVRYNEGIPIFIELCMLSEELLASCSQMHIGNSRYLNKNFTALPLTDYDIFVLEETNALTEKEMNTCVTCFKEPKTKTEGSKHHPIIWVTTSLSTSEFLEKCPIFKANGFYQIHVSDNSMRNTSEVVSFSNLVETYIAPERFPSSRMSRNNTPEGIPISYYYCETDASIIDEIVLTVERWLDVPDFTPSQLLIINAVDDKKLSSTLKLKKIPLKKNDCQDEHNEASLLLHAFKDPVESVLAGGEWAVLILYFKYETILSHRAVQLFNKRIMSRASAKVYLFSDYKVDEISLERNIDYYVDPEKNAESKETKQLTGSEVRKFLDDAMVSSVQEYNLLNFAVVSESSNASLNSDEPDSDVWLIQHRDTPDRVYLMSTSLSTHTLQQARNYFVEQFNVKLPVVCEDPELKDDDYDPKCENWKAKISRVKVLIDTFGSPQSSCPVFKMSEWIEIRSHENIEKFLSPPVCTRSGWIEITSHENIEKFLKTLKEGELRPRVTKDHIIIGSSHKGRTRFFGFHFKFQSANP